MAAAYTLRSDERARGIAAHWNLYVTDRASRFYERLFGWRVGKEEEDPAHHYYHLFNHDQFIGGILPPAFRGSGAPPALADLRDGLRLRRHGGDGQEPWSRSLRASDDD